jgi:cell division septation protein DedD
VTLVACDEPPSFLQPSSNSSSGAEKAPSAASKFSEKDVEAPEVFQKTEKALWDGRPSLGGVWVAHPDNKKPERVIIRNEANGKFVIGALFNREKSLPGPPFQLSSDAAVALGVPAGTTLDLSVTAMRTEKKAVAEAETPKAAPSEDVATKDKVATEDSSDIEAKSNQDPLEEAKPLTFKEKMAARKAARAAKKASKAAANTVGDVSQTTLPAAPGAASAPTAAPVAKPVSKPAVQPVAKPSSASDVKYVQLGLFSVEANAKATLAKVQAKGMQGKIATSSAKGKKFHRVLAGPASNSAEQAKIMKTIKSMGFSDAYLVKG